MADILFKRSSTPSAVPGTSDLAFGAIGINTYDGKIFIKKDSGTPAIIEVGPAITVKDEGTNLTTATSSIDFVGAGVVATNTGGAVTVTIAGGGGTAAPAEPGTGSILYMYANFS